MVGYCGKPVQLQKSNMVQAQEMHVLKWLVQQFAWILKLLFVSSFLLVFWSSVLPSQSMVFIVSGVKWIGVVFKNWFKTHLKWWPLFQFLQRFKFSSDCHPQVVGAEPFKS